MAQLSGLEYLLLFQRAGVQFLAPTSNGSQLAVTPASGEQIPSSGLFKCMPPLPPCVCGCVRVRAPPHRNNKTNLKN